MSILLMSYIWSNAHRTGNDLVYCPTELTLGTCTNSADPTFFLFGALGVCDYSPANPMATSPAPAAGQRGWATDEPLTSDFACQHWMSALLLSESNNFGVHNLFSAMGPSSSAAPGTIGQQLTMAASAVRGDQYYFGTETPVRSITDGCAVGTTGPANCGWTTAFIGTCTPSDTVTMKTQKTRAIPSMVMVNQGIHANDYPFLPPGKGISESSASGDGAEALADSVDAAAPSISSGRLTHESTSLRSEVTQSRSPPRPEPVPHSVTLPMSSISIHAAIGKAISPVMSSPTSIVAKTSASGEKASSRLDNGHPRGKAL